MDRELVLVTLMLALCGPALLTGGLLPPPPVNEGNADRLERIRWARLWLGLAPATLLFAFLVGWALREPSESDERVSATMLLLIAPFAAIWLRAIGRAAISLRRAGHSAPAATVGFFRPRVVLAPAFVAALDPRELLAVRAHEAAHARHRDPMRLWLGQLAADLQWPLPGASRRFLAWRQALEIARDAEARRDGAEGADLAAAIVIAARIEGPGLRAVVAALTSGENIRDRVVRLLEPLPEPVPPRRRWRTAIATAALLLLAFGAGLAFGETFVRALPGIVT